MKMNLEHDVRARDRILLAARDEFSLKGYKGARTADIAERAGVNKALIHYYFENKEKLYAEVIDLVFGSGAEVDIPLYPGHWDLTSAQKLYACFYCFVKMHINSQNERVMRMSFWEFLDKSPHLNSVFEGITWPQHNLLSRIIEEGVRNGEFRQVETHLLSLNVISFIGLYSMNVNILADTGYYKKYLKKYDESHVLNYVFSHSISYLSGKRNASEIPEIPGDLLELIDRLAAYFLKGDHEGVIQFMSGQMMDILMHN